jgi:hypothetical protein
MDIKRELTNSLLQASLCNTREEARNIIRKADQASIKLSGLPYGFPMNIKTDETN